MRSIKWKVVVMFVALVFIVMIASGTFILTSIKTKEELKSRENLTAYARYINQQIIGDGEFTEEDFDEGLAQHAKNFVTKGGESLQGSIINARGETIASTVEHIRYAKSVITMALDGTEEFAAWVRSSDSIGQTKTWMEYAMPVYDTDKDVKYVIYVREDAETISATLYNITSTIIIAVALAMVLTVFLSIWFSSTLTKAIITLTHKSREIAEGRLLEEIPVTSGDEIGDLTRSFNQMANDLHDTMNDMASEKEKLEIVLHNMTDGVLAYDGEGKLIHANYACKELLNNISPETFTLESMEEYLGFEPENHDINEATRLIGEKYISSYLTAYRGAGGSSEGRVIVLQDITKHKKLDNMRKEFVANVSHELRTPLTTIKSYAETLLDGALEQHEIAEEFLNIIDSEVDRMTFLVKDLLDLSQLDNKYYAMEMQEINLIDMIRESIMQNKILAEKKGQRIIFDPSTDEMMTEGNASRINQVLNNILTNAIKYGYDNTDIRIFVDATHSYYRVYVSDDGIGIPKDDIPRIFERFYRVDKARSRAMGGTGLGLAIAKQIMEAHGGKISVNSEPNKGTTMILRFRKISDTQSANLSM